jgi:hypothetical protein
LTERRTRPERRREITSENDDYLTGDTAFADSTEHRTSSGVVAPRVLFRTWDESVGDYAGVSMLHEFITANREEIIYRCRAKVVIRSAPPRTKVEIDHGVPIFLDQLVEELRRGPSSNADNQKIKKTATQHGNDLLRQGFTVSQVVHDYGDVCQTITELAMERNAPINTPDFRTLNRCLDDAIAGAVTEYGRERDQSMDGETAGESERFGAMARDLRTSIHAASVALEAIKAGRVGVAGSTGAVLDRSLVSAHDLIDRLLAEVYVPNGTKPVS